MYFLRSARWLVSLAVFGVLATLLSLHATAFGDQSGLVNRSDGAVESDGKIDDLPSVSSSEALEQDAAHLAELKGLSQEDAKAALVIGEQLGPVVAALRDAIGNREVAITKVYEPTVHLRVEISRGEALNEVAHLVDQNPGRIEVQYVDKPSISELAQVVESSQRLWEATYPGFVRATVDDGNYNRVLVFFAADEVKPSVDELRRVTPAFPQEAQLSVLTDSAEYGGKLYSRGNLRLNHQIDGADECTWPHGSEEHI